MGGEEIIRVGAFTLADSDVGWAIGFGVVVAAFVLAPAARPRRQPDTDRVDVQRNSFDRWHGESRPPDCMASST